MYRTWSPRLTQKKICKQLKKVLTTGPYWESSIKYLRYFIDDPNNNSGDNIFLYLIYKWKL